MRWLGPSNKYINVMGCGVQIKLDMRKGRQKVDFSPGDKTLCVQPPHCYYLEAQLAIGADKEGTDKEVLPAAFYFGSAPISERLERGPSLAAQLVEEMSVCGTCLWQQALLSAVALCPTASMLGLPSPSKVML